MAHQDELLDHMLDEIKQTIGKYKGSLTDTSVELEKSEETGKMQITIRVKNESEMKIEFRQGDAITDGFPKNHDMNLK
ncbi:hypothetical protein [Providencia sp. NPDC089923]|uniref:hypothetical protein n=1 Tax=Providencia sp. NPDC089923 TaxID=3415004 RepID=UPI003C2C1497